MKTKIITKASAVLMTLIVMLSLTLTAFADRIFIPNAGTGVEHVYIYDETNRMTQADKDELARKMTEVYNLTDCDIGFFFAAHSRLDQDVVDITRDAAEDIYYSSGTKGAFIIYLNYTDGKSGFNHIHCAGEAHELVPNGDNSDYNATAEILHRAKYDRLDDDSKSKSWNMMDRASYICDSIMLYVNSFADFVSVGMEEFSSASSSNPDNYILESSSFRNDYVSSNTTGKSKTYNTDHVLFFDEGGLFNNTEVKKILDMFEGTSQEIQFNLVLYAATQSRSDSSVESKARSSAFTVFPYSTFTGTVCLYIDLDGFKNAYDYMFCQNDSFLYYTNGDDGTEDRIKKILHAMQSYFPAGGQQIIIGQIINGLEEYCKQLVQYKAKGLVEGIYHIDDLKGEYVYASGGKIVHSKWKPYKYWWAGILIGLAIGAIVAVIAKSVVRKRYKFKTSASASLYTSQEKIFMRHSQDVFIGSHVSKVRIQSSSGGHGGHGGGGGHHGGGGGGSHR